MGGGISTGKVDFFQIGSERIALGGGGTPGVERTDRMLTGFRIGAAEPAQTPALLLLGKRGRPKSKGSFFFRVHTRGQLIQSNATAQSPLSKGLGINCVIPVVRPEMVGHSADG